MSQRVIRLLAVTPARDLVLATVVHLRFDGADGSRGILPGHAPFSSVLRSGALFIQSLEAGSLREHFVATEGGMVIVAPEQVVLVTPWAAISDDLSKLAAKVRARGARRASIDAAQRSAGTRHEVALRRALIGLKREVSW